MRRINKANRGFTLIEAIMVIVILAIFSYVGAWLFIYLIQSSVFMPNQLNMDMLASDALDTMIEGDSQAKGLRFSLNVTACNNNNLTFYNQDGQSVRYRLDNVTNKLYRSIAGGSDAFIPSYTKTGINITAKNNKLFTYYDASEAVTNNPADVRRVKMILIAKTGSGLYSDWEGLSEQCSSIAVDKFQ